MYSVIQTLSRYLILLLLTISCSPQYKPYTGDQAIKTTAAVPQYNDLIFWAAHPLKKDPSDSIPAPLRVEVRDSLADVFFIHPTTYTRTENESQINAPINDNYINAKTDFSSILYQASVFNASANIYAPRYRQAFLGMYFEQDRLKANTAFDTAYADIRNSFSYYLKNYNKGRPIIIASHSQGTTHAKRLLSEFFEGKPLMKQLVCAYLLGMPVEKSFFREIPVCQDSSSTGCFMSWRTYRQGYHSNTISPDDTTISVINPLSWNNFPETIPAKEHKGAVLYNFNKIYKQTQNASISGNVLWITKPRFPGGFFFFRKNYHPGDVNLFYMNIREDVRRRINHYFQIKNHNPA